LPLDVVASVLGVFTVATAAGFLLRMNIKFCMSLAGNFWREFASNEPRVDNSCSREDWDIRTLETKKFKAGPGSPVTPMDSADGCAELDERSGCAVKDLPWFTQAMGGGGVSSGSAGSDCTAVAGLF